MAHRKISASSAADRKISFSGFIVRAIVLFLALEGIARLWLFHIADEQQFMRFAALEQISPQQLGQSSRFLPHRYLSYIPTPGLRTGKNQHNNLGFRGEDFPEQKPEGEYRIVCIGASTTYGAFIYNESDNDWRNSYPHQLEQALHAMGHQQVRVINAGVGGWRSWESFINLQFRLLPLQPDLLIIYEGINDVRARMIWPPEAYRADNSGFTHSGFTRRTFQVWEHSTLLRSVMITLGQSEPQASYVRLVDPENRKHSFSKEFLRQQHKRIYPSGIFRQASAMQMLDANPPLYFERNIASMIAIAKANGIKVVLGQFAFDAPHFHEFPSSSSPEFVRGIKEHNAVLVRLAQSHAVRLVDFNQWIPKDRQHFADGHHFSALGSQVLAGKLAQYIDNQRLLPTHSQEHTTPVD